MSTCTTHPESCTALHVSVIIKGSFHSEPTVLRVRAYCISQTFVANFVERRCLDWIDDVSASLRRASRSPLKQLHRGGSGAEDIVRRIEFG